MTGGANLAAPYGTVPGLSCNAHVAASFGQSGDVGCPGSSPLASRAEQLPLRGRERREVQGGARRFTSGLNSLCSAPGQGWEEQPPVDQH